jgi:hypothetical protein
VELDLWQGWLSVRKMGSMVEYGGPNRPHLVDRGRDGRDLHDVIDVLYKKIAPKIATKIWSWSAQFCATKNCTKK